MNAPTSELAVLFADVSGSTRLYETLGDERALSAIAHCLDVAKSACAGYGGRVINPQPLFAEAKSNQPHIRTTEILDNKPTSVQIKIRRSSDSKDGGPR